MFLRTLHVVGREGAEYAGRETATLPQDVRGRPYAESAPAPGSLAFPLEIQKRDIPQPGPGQVLVRLEACGLCHTDIHAAHGDWPVKPAPPFVPGHEGVGIVERLGDAVTDRTEQVNDAIAEVLSGKVLARLVFEY